ncbi:DUF4232 domain-containing protein [Streptacidiphilus sp. ASG 303]|uniref:DUF4232 domain-containing protein n=1 Tax=Streptacidiphilus sp. ASG 303 TaxID=2896847 RepID=UPI001E42D726|nr:DUF4232 domain-containing protein [Streptacidiphilus sp. ASG 303]MCD0485732.1 DUF4232 domain-containing protein [Streptacidiphilus sp. ASG 303]
MKDLRPVRNQAPRGCVVRHVDLTTTIPRGDPVRLVRTTAFAAAALVAGLGLTACNDTASGSAASAGGSTTAAAPAGGTGSGTGGGAAAATPAGAPGQGKGTGAASTGGTGSGTAAGTRCRTADLAVSVTGPASDASEQEPATAAVQVVNTSGRTCTLKGFPGVEVRDDQGKSSPLTARRQDSPATAVRLAPGAKAVARLAYGNVNGEGSASARKVCGVQSAYASVILPDETAVLKVRVRGGVDNGTLDVCGPEIAVSPFEPLAG